MANSLGPLTYKAGVYEVRCSTNGRRYIGSSVDLQGRFAEHRRHLVTGNHHCTHLQRSWNKYGESAFVFRPLLLCSPTMCLFYEQSCIDGLRPEFNVAKSVTRSRLGLRNTPEQNAKIGNANRGRKQTKEQRLANGERKRQEWRDGKLKPPPAMPPEVKARVDAGKRGRKQPLAAVELRAIQARERMKDPLVKAAAVAILHSNRQAAVAAITKKLRTAESREAARARMLKRWTDPSFRAKVLQASVASRTQEWRANLSLGQKRRIERDPSWRLRLTQGLAKSGDHHGE